ncbi:MAG: glycosyl transferase [Bernardetiaceae bacterium]|jgi:uncharacterized protein (TIGR00661 family)|nr:glycosyl transferase [Bernardetiaceae bacterium]
MKILYAVQGTGNGHLSRAREIVPLLQQMAETDVMVSGTNSEIILNAPLKYRSQGLSIFYDKDGGVSLRKTFKNLHSGQLKRDIRSLPVEDYDLVINDFEPVSAYACVLKGVPCVGFGHQAAFLSKKSPRPKRRSYVGEFILKNYAPCHHAMGLHFDTFDTFIHRPVIRQDIRRLEPTDQGHYTVYLGHYHDQVVLDQLTQVPDVEWHLFSKTAKTIVSERNVTILPIASQTFAQSMASCAGLITGAGFEAPAEAIYLGKKVMAIPIKGQYEQKCNARALQNLGVTVVKKIGRRFPEKLRDWLAQAHPLQIDYPDQTQQLLEAILKKEGLRKCNVKPKKLFTTLLSL